MWSEGNVNGSHYSSVASADSARSAGDIGKTGSKNRPTHDQIYLAEKLNYYSDGGKRGFITPAAIQRWNMRYGVSLVSDALRQLHGFPPENEVISPYSYVAAILKNSVWA